MKKLFLFAVLIPVISGTIFAQGLSFDGYINSGLGVVTKEEQDDSQLKAYAADAGQNGYRFRLNGSYQNEAKTAGAKFRLQSQANLTQGSYSVNESGSGNTSGTHEFISLPYALGWISFINNIFNLSAGIIEDSTWTTGDWWLASDSVSAYAGLGTLFKITPVEGLVFGAGVQTIGRRGGGNNNTLAKTSFGSAVNLKDARYHFHAGYTMKDAFRLDFSYRTESKIGADESSRLFADFRLLAVKNLTAVAALSINNIGENFDTAGQMIFSETFGYKIDKINFGLNAAQFIYNNAAGNYEPGLLFNLWGSYAFNIIAPRIDIAYFMNGESTLSQSATTWLRNGFAPTGKDVSVLSFRPSVRFNIDNKTHIEIGDMINIDKLGSDNDSFVTNVFYIDLKWSF